MENWKELSVLIVLGFLFLLVTKNLLCETFTSNEHRGHGHGGHGATHDDDDTDDEDDDTEDDTEDTEEDASGDDSAVAVEPIDAPAQVASSTSHVEDTLVLRDTVRKDSKVGSSLDYTYLDERCDKLVKPVPPPFPAETHVLVEPKTPMIEHVSPQPPQTVQAPKPIENITSQPPSQAFHSEMFDDEELKPKPSIDSPYGFVYFPNKYWNQWHQKPPVCTPTHKCKVLPTYTQGTPVDVLDYTQMGSLMPKGAYREEFEESRV